MMKIEDDQHTLNQSDNKIINRNWYVLQTRPRKEILVVSQVELKNIEVFCPFIEKIQIWSDRKKKVKVPLFSGYVFVKATVEERKRAITDTIGALKYIFFQKRPAIVKNEEIELIKKALEEPDRISIVDKKIKKGDLIKVTYGHFKGMKGIVNEFRGKYKLTVNLEELSYSVSIILNSNEIEQIVD
ncbi:MAG: UpxY family transcription antiterminator [Ignavibacteria bacterium]|jgi:transcriptional antiterminator RfaH|nr:UpxY family transcription antiterminator [Ignavibacteria bacterium]